MISKKFTVYSRKQRIIIGILEVIQLLMGLILLLTIICSMIFKQETINITTIIMGIAAIISLIEFVWRKMINKYTFFYKKLLQIYKSTYTSYYPTSTQMDVCAWITNNIQNDNIIAIYGKPDIGKTSSVFMFLEKNTKDYNLLKNINWDKNILYIDCKNNKNEIFNFFYEEARNVQRVKYENSLIIIDNLEVMAKSFQKNLYNRANCCMGRFILLFDTYNSINTSLKSKYMEKNNTLKESDLYKFKTIYEKLSNNEKIVLLIIYYISLSHTLIQINDINTMFCEDLSYFRIKLILFSLLQKHFIIFFPFDYSYIIMVKRIEMSKILTDIGTTQQNLSAVDKMFLNSEKFPESAWISLIKLPYEKIMQMDIAKREQLFSSALSSGNYSSLCKIILDELEYSPIKENIFLYEIGTLYFFNSRQEDAFKKYNNLIKQENTENKRKRIMLRIIEATHGDTNSATQGNIKLYISELLNSNYEYSLYAEYWNLHIKTEKGIFFVEKYEQLLNNLVNYKSNIQDWQIYQEITKRCYTDIIRACHILMKSTIQTDLPLNFINFLKETSCNNEIIVKYYNSLYIKANTLHYVDMMNAILNSKNCQDIYEEALSSYNLAITCGYENQKSVSACEIKSIDLKMYSDENVYQFDEYEMKIKSFMANAEINKVHVHVAYCKTLLAKLYMVQNLYDNEYRKLSNRQKKNSKIKACLQEAKKIYKVYKNDYGIIRIDFLELLYNIASASSKSEFEKIVQKMTDILEKHQEYQREMHIIQFYKNIIANDISFGMLSFSILKAYPMIMQ